MDLMPSQQIADQFDISKKTKVTLSHLYGQMIDEVETFSERCLIQKLLKTLALSEQPNPDIIVWAGDIYVDLSEKDIPDRF
jgi:hypothetical protein